MELEEALARWDDRLPSRLCSHPGECCDTARVWLRAMDSSMVFAQEEVSGPVWISRRYRWGPSRWPLHWCEAVRSEVLDCGAQAALALEALAQRRRSVARAQLILRVPERVAAHWAARWEAAGQSADWLVGDLAYHEACVVAREDEIAIWDSSRGGWLEGADGTFVRVLALRVVLDGGIGWPGASTRLAALAGRWVMASEIPGAVQG